MILIRDNIGGINKISVIGQLQIEGTDALFAQGTPLDFQKRVEIDTANLTGIRSLEWPDIDNATISVWSKVTQNLTADDTVLIITSSYLELSSDSATATDRTVTISTSGLVAGQEFSLGWQGPNKGELENTGIMSLTATWLPDDEDVIPLIFDGTNIRENGIRAANRDH